MPQARLPPTPASSTDLHGEEKLIGLTPALALPPSAYAEQSEDDLVPSPPSPSNASDSSYHPDPPVAPPSKRQKHVAPSDTFSAKKASGGDITLPPPPSRSRKIIQVKPKGSDSREQQSVGDEEAATHRNHSTTSGRGKRGRDGNATAAGRKMARKTAHSIIERRRRSKMNEDFGVLKGLIPACRGHEMHKLAIIQASIEYLLYLESCICDLKAANRATGAESLSSNVEVGTSETPAADVEDGEPMEYDSDGRSTGADETMTNNDENDNDTDIAVTTVPAQDEQVPLTHFTPLNASPQYPTSTTPTPLISPSIHPTTLPQPQYQPQFQQYQPQQRHYPISSVTHPSPSFSPYMPASNQTSPFFGPNHSAQEALVGFLNSTSFALTSPALGPQDPASSSSPTVLGRGPGSQQQQQQQQIQHLALNGDSDNDHSSDGGRSGQRQQQQKQNQTQQSTRERELDHEVTAALLMLNSDRRGWWGEERQGNRNKGQTEGEEKEEKRRGRGMSVMDLLS
ncbi:hypothetical protein AAFC00_005327 [Neodothiora populina]|uniref:BHLH domain-containing protein n=1 Tax=Neodothiora populina TaxID=2781224 RepID=A0ABR3PKW9_9PEZI